MKKTLKEMAVDRVKAMNEDAIREGVKAHMRSGRNTIKPCPLCGAKAVLMGSEQFERLKEKNDYGHACISIECSNPDCGIQLYDHTHEELDYDIRAFIITEKWNRRKV